MFYSIVAIFTFAAKENYLNIMKNKISEVIKIVQLPPTVLKFRSTLTVMTSPYKIWYQKLSFAVIRLTFIDLALCHLLGQTLWSLISSTILCAVVGWMRVNYSPKSIITIIRKSPKITPSYSWNLINLPHPSILLDPLQLSIEDYQKKL